MRNSMVDTFIIVFIEKYNRYIKNAYQSGYTIIIINLH